MALLKASQPNSAERASGAELDLLVIADGRRVGFEIKYTASPRLTQSMRAAIDTLKLDRLVVVYPGDRGFQLAEHIGAIGLADLVGTGFALLKMGD